MWRRDLPAEATDPCVIQQPDPWRTRENMGNKDPQRFAYAIVCKHCDIARNSLGGMKVHLDFCPIRKRPDILCGHCELHVNDWPTMVRHLNKKYMERELPCKPEYKMANLRPTTLFPGEAPKYKHCALKVLGHEHEKQKGRHKYNAWSCMHPQDIHHFRNEAADVRRKVNTKSHKVTSPEKCVEQQIDKDDVRQAALIAGIILPDEQETTTVTETDTGTVPEIPNESSDSDETALIPLPDPETVPLHHTKCVHFADVEPDSEPNLLDMVPLSPTQSRVAWAYSNVQPTVSVDTILRQQRTLELTALTTTESSIPTTTLIDTLQWRTKTTFPRLELTLPSQKLLDTMLGDADKSLAQTPGIPTVEKASPFSTPVINLSPILEPLQCIVTTADVQNCPCHRRGTEHTYNNTIRYSCFPICGLRRLDRDITGCTQNRVCRCR